MTGTIAVRVTDPITTPYLITIPIDIYCAQLAAGEFERHDAGQWPADLSAADPPLRQHLEVADRAR